MRAIFYMHGGSGNHGCEAIVRSSYNINRDLFEEIQLFSHNTEEDRKFLQDLNVSIKSSWRQISKLSLTYVVMALKMKILKKHDAYIKYRYKDLIDSFANDTIAFSIGGDNYCYDGMPEVLSRLHQYAMSKGARTVLWGASIEPELLQDKKIIEDMKKYHLIVVRESISYEALIQAGIIENVRFFPDPAFTLQKRDVQLPGELTKKAFVGINLSPLVMSCGENNNVAYENFRTLIQYIIEKTDLSIVLIPHVVWEENDDRVPLTKLYKQYKYSERVYLIDDMNAMQLKGIISRCKFFIGARTHATIAAYSMMVPTLVMGYSVKASGIARDIFGTEENYVISVQKLKSVEELKDAFLWLMSHEQEIKDKLRTVMPDYIDRSYQARDEVHKMLDNL